MAQVVILTDISTRSGEMSYGRPLGPYILATKARSAGYDCVVVENFTKSDRIFDALETLIGPETLFVGISGTFLVAESQNKLQRETLDVSYGAGYLWLNTRQELEQWVARLKKLLLDRGAKAPIVLAGKKGLHGVTEEKLHGLFDFCVIGRSESFFVDLVRRIESNQPLPFRSFNGAQYLVEQDFNLPTPPIEVVRWDPIDQVGAKQGLPIEIAKGCRFNCKFCNYDKQSTVRKNSDTIKEELVRNYEQFGTTLYSFVDDTFNDTRAKTEDICNAILSLPFKIEWVSFVRPDVACAFPQTLDLMVESGARGLYWGIETFNAKVSRAVGKGTDPELIKSMLIDFKSKYGDRTLTIASFIIGLVGETEESIRSTIDWICETKALDFVNIPVLGLFPFSERLDKVVFDYSDYSRQPEKYGFQSISHDPYYWKHATMDSTRAYELKLEFQKRFFEVGLSGSWVWTTFQYVHLRGLGFSHEEISNFARKDHWNSKNHKRALMLEQNQIDRYFDGLVASARAKKSWL